MRIRRLLPVLIAQAVFASVTYTYDSAGRLAVANYGSGGCLIYKYDSAGHLVSRQHGTASGDINGDGVTNVVDVQLMINEALGGTKAVNDLNADGAVNVVDVQIVIDAVFNMGCVTT